MEIIGRNAKPAIRRASGALLAAMLFWAAGVGEARGETVTILLKWFHQFQFAGLYAAQNKGFFKEEGLEVRLVEGRGGRGRKNLELVLSKPNHYGILGPGLLKHYQEGKKVVALSAFFQHSPLVLVSLKKAGIVAPRDLAGKSIMTGRPGFSTEIYALLEKYGLTGKVRIVRFSWKTAFADLISGKVDSLATYSTQQVPAMRRKGIEINVLRPWEHGVDYYGDILFTARRELEERPGIVDKVRHAVNRGWRYAMNNPEEIIDYILTLPGVAERGVTRDTLRDEAAAMRELIRHDFIEVGYMNPERWKRIGAFYKDLGLITESRQDIENFIFQHQHGLDPDLLRLIAILGALAMVISAIAFWIHRLNKQLRREVKERERAEVQIRELAMTDPLTGLANRNAFNTQIKAAVSLARRQGNMVALLMLDLDNFKPVNDTHGHPVGDELLREVGRRLKALCRETDTVARIGGDEFAFVLVSLKSEENVTRIAGEIVRILAQLTSIMGHEVKIGGSIGVAFAPDATEDIDDLIKNADEALYAAKKAGRGTYRIHRAEALAG